MPSSLFEYYNNLFEGIVANTATLQEECYRLRHQVYCVEHPFLPRDPVGLERDEHEENSAHALLRYRPAQVYVGTVRLVLQNPDARVEAIPVYKLCAQAAVSLPPSYTPETTGEISRFAISKMFRRRAEDTLYPATYSRAELAEDKARVIPCMALGLMTMIHQMAKKHEVDKFCAVMEPALLRLLAKLGIHFHLLGPLVEYHGQRQICYITTDEIRWSVARERPDVLEVLKGRE